VNKGETRPCLQDSRNATEVLQGIGEIIPGFCDLLSLKLDMEKNYADFIAARYGTYHPW
jgi:hypothetical protein